ERFDFRAREKPWRPARYVALVVPPAGQGDVRRIDLGEASNIDAAVDQVRKSLGGRLRPSAPAANQGPRGTSAGTRARCPSWCWGRCCPTPRRPGTGSSRLTAPCGWRRGRPYLWVRRVTSSRSTA